MTTGRDLDPPWEDPVGVATVYPVVQNDVALDVALVERHRCGDLQAFDEVYERFGEMVYNLALRLAGNREEAADLTQEIFLRIYRHLGSFGGRSTLKTWVFRIALNHCRDRLSRHHPAMQSIDDQAEGGGIPIADPGRGSGRAGGRRRRGAPGRGGAVPDSAGFPRGGGLARP